MRWSAIRADCAVCAGTGGGGGRRVPEGLVVLVALLALGAGGGLGWLLARDRLAARSWRERDELRQRLVAMETRADVLGKQLSQREMEAGGLAETLRAEQA